MEKLTNEQIVEICCKTIHEIEEYRKLSIPIFLCNTISTKISDALNIPYQGNKDVYRYIPEFNQKNAAKYANSDTDDGIWWNDINGCSNYSDRIKFMEWIKSQYQNK